MAGADWQDVGQFDKIQKALNDLSHGLLVSSLPDADEEKRAESLTNVSHGMNVLNDELVRWLKDFDRRIHRLETR